MTPEQIEAVVRRLSQAQREVVLRCRDEWLNSREIGASGTTLRSLCFPPLDANLRMPPHILSRDYQDLPLRYIYRLTSFGLAVRAALEKAK